MPPQNTSATRKKPIPAPSQSTQSASTGNQSSRPHGSPRVSDYKDVDGSPGRTDWLVTGVVLVITWPIIACSKFVGAFVEKGGPGVKALGGVAFLSGVMMGADSFYQLFGDRALLPWYTTSPWVGDLAVEGLPFALKWVNRLWGGQTFVGWSAVFLSMFSLFFLFCAAFSLLTQLVQGKAIRGGSIEKNMSEFQKWNSPSMPSAPDPDRKLDMANVSWKELKQTGKKQNGFIGLIGLSLWALETVSAFAAHNPLNYVGQAGLFVGCTIYALVTICAGEVGYAIYCEATDQP